MMARSFLAGPFLQKILPVLRDNSTSAILGSIAVTFAIVAYFQMRRGNRYAKIQATAAAEKPKLDLLFFGQRNIESFIVAVPLTKRAILEVPIPFHLLNGSEKSATDVQLYLKMPNVLCFANLATYDMSSPFREATINTVDSGNFRTVILNIKAIHGNESHVAYLQLSLSFDTDLQLAKGVTVTIAFVIDATVAHIDGRTFSKRFYLQVMNTSEDEPAEILKKNNRRISRDRIGPRITKQVFGAEPHEEHIAIAEYPKDCAKNVQPGLDKIEAPSNVRIITGFHHMDGSYTFAALGVRPFKTS